MACNNIDCGAMRQPPYAMRYKPPQPAQTKLSADMAYEYYVKLAPFWGIEECAWPPGSYKGERALFHKFAAGAFWHRVSWMPVLRPGWRRPSYREFLEIYAIPEAF